MKKPADSSSAASAVIFLDIDGVLLPYKKNRKPAELIPDLNTRLAREKNCPAIAGLPNGLVSQFYSGFDSRALEWIRQLQQKFKAEIIIDSSWRVYYFFEQLEAIFKMFDIQIHGLLPAGFPRFKAIQDYVRAHHLKKWIAIDDMDMKKGLGAHFVQTDSVMNEENFQEACRKLARL